MPLQLDGLEFVYAGEDDYHDLGLSIGDDLPEVIPEQVQTYGRNVEHQDEQRKHNEQPVDSNPIALPQQASPAINPQRDAQYAQEDMEIGVAAGTSYEAPSSLQATLGDLEHTSRHFGPNAINNTLELLVDQGLKAYRMVDDLVGGSSENEFLHNADRLPRHNGNPNTGSSLGQPESWRVTKPTCVNADSRYVSSGVQLKLPLFKSYWWADRVRRSPVSPLALPVQPRKASPHSASPLYTDDGGVGTFKELRGAKGAGNGLFTLPMANTPELSHRRVQLPALLPICQSTTPTTTPRRAFHVNPSPWSRSGSSGQRSSPMMNASAIHSRNHSIASIAPSINTLQGDDTRLNSYDHVQFELGMASPLLFGAGSSVWNMDSNQSRRSFGTPPPG